MKRQRGKERKAGTQNLGASEASAPVSGSSGSEAVRGEQENRKKPLVPAPKKEPEKRGEEKASVFRYVGIAIQFLRESRMELRKVKWPTRKELLASTGVVIALVIIVSFFLGLIDLGLIKIIKNIVG